MLRGRTEEAATLDRLLGQIRRGESHALILHGEPGIGKTALLDDLARRATGCTVVRTAGAESEMELPFAGLHGLCAPMLDRLGDVPEPQRAALSTAFGLTPGPAPDGAVVALATLALLAGAAEERPLVCLVDDAQWLDSASADALGLVARRLVAESVAIVVAARPEQVGDAWSGLAQLEISGLGDDDARALLDTAVRAPLDDVIRERILAEARGNPLALLELQHGLALDDLAGGFGLPRARTLSGRLERSFARRLEPLPRDTQVLLQVAAADPTGDARLVLRAAGQLGAGAQSAAPAAAAGLFELADAARFRHPLVRSAVYRAASPEDRRRAHRALAAATDAEHDPDRRAWHAAEAAAGPDEAVAAELERSAGRAQARGGLAAAAAFLRRSAALTLAPDRRVQRALAAAEAAIQAGAPEGATALLQGVEHGPLDELQRARVDRLRAQAAFALNRGRDAPPLLLAAARRLETLDPALARDTYLDALSAATFVGRAAEPGDVGAREVARAAREAPPWREPPRAADLLVDGLALALTDGPAAAAPALRRAIAAFLDARVSREEELRWLWLAGHAAMDVWDDEAWYVLARRHVRLAREAGALTVLPIALNTWAGVQLATGELAKAASVLEEAGAIGEATGTHLAPYVPLALAAFRGDETEATRLFDLTMGDVAPRGEGIGVTIAHWASAVLLNGLGRYEDALAAAQRGSEHPEELRFWLRSILELIEAAARSGRPELGEAALGQLTASTQASGSDLALGTEARARALLSEGAEAERLHMQAVERLGRTRVRSALARAQLVYGEWLRREQRRREAREQLAAAREEFSRFGMEAFAARAERELRATGATARRRTVETSGELTAQEAQVVRLARSGLSNPEIGARLFISTRTVEYHLRNVFAKLGISSRSQLAQALGPEHGSPAPQSVA